MVELGRKIVRVLLLHQVCILVLEFVNNEDALRSVTKLDQCLQDATTIVLVAQFGILFTDGFDALLDDGVFLFPTHLLLLHEQTIV